MSSKNNKVLYLGVTNNIERRVWEHRNKFNQNSFASKYNCVKLVYVERTNSIIDAITREKQLKNWTRDWKNKLIEEQNPMWRDLAAEVFGKGELRDCGSSPQ